MTTAEDLKSLLLTIQKDTQETNKKLELIKSDIRILKEENVKISMDIDVEKDRCRELH